MPSPLRLLATALAATLPCTAQSPNAWAELRPAGGVAAAAVRGQGKLVSYDAGDTLHVFSSITRRWHHVDKSPTATLELFNDCAVLFDGHRIVAISSYDGQRSDLQVSPNAVLWNGANAKNDSIVLVRDGAALHAFSAFTGRWVTRALAANASGSVRRHVAVVHSGTRLWGMSAFDGRWHDTGAGQLQSLDTDGTAGFAVGARVYAFSAHNRSWSKSPTLANATFQRGDDWGLWHDGQGGFAYSGLVGSFTTFSLPNAGVVASSDLFALLESNGSLHAYSAVTADVVPVGATATSIETGLATALLHDAAGVRGYSALRQQTQTLPIASIGSAAGASAAYATDGGGLTHAFSAVTASWHAAPAATIGRAPLATTTTIALEAGSDCYAFAANRGQFVPLGRPVQGLAGNPSSAPLLAHDGASLFAFDGDQARWIATPRTGTGTPLFRIWRTTALVVDGDHAHGIGAQAGRWHHLDLGPHALAPFANSEVGYLLDGQRIAACGMLAEIVSMQQFPHFRRVQPRGAEIEFSTTPLRDAVVIAGFAPPGPPTTIPGLGELHLDLGSTFVVQPTPDRETGVARVAWTMPPSPALAGATVFAQLLLAPNDGSAPYLGDRSTVQLW
jgi:hypothetical protein